LLKKFDDEPYIEPDDSASMALRDFPERIKSMVDQRETLLKDVLDWTFGRDLPEH
jgi:hypothetical protein